MTKHGMSGQSVLEWGERKGFPSRFGGNVPVADRGWESWMRRRRSCRPRMLQVLVVAPTRRDQSGLVRFVEQCGHQAHAAADAASSWRIAETTRVDVVFLKLEMPLATGLRTASAIKLHSAIRASLMLAIAERPDPERHHQCRDAGIDVVLSDSVDPSVVETLLLLECLHVNRRYPRPVSDRVPCEMLGNMDSLFVTAPQR